MADIRGDSIQLRTIGHTISGSVKNRLILGRKLPGQFHSEITIIENDQKSVASFSKNEDGSFGGVVTLPSSSEDKKYNIVFKVLDRDRNTFVVDFDGEIVDVEL